MPETVICQFRVKPGQQDTLIEMCRKHDRTLRELGLITDEPTLLYRGASRAGEPFVVKIFEWKSAEAVRAAHQHPEVQVHWEAMEPLCESMEFPHAERVAL